MIIFLNYVVPIFLIFTSSAFAADGKDASKEATSSVVPKNTNDPKDETKADSKDSEIANILNSMGYPELQVVPRASERLRIEAKEERGSWFVMHWPIELSGLATLYNGLTADNNLKSNLSSNERSDAKTIHTFTAAVGAAWVTGGLILGFQRPYAQGYRSLSKGQPKDDRQALMRERLAEEALERPARVMRVLKHISVITNFSMNALSAIHLDDQGKVVAGTAAVLAFLPYMFEDHTIAVHDKHIEYKKKIYTPLKGASLFVDPESKKMTPLTTLTWNF